MTAGWFLAMMTSRCAGGTDSRASQFFRTAGGVMDAVQRMDDAALPAMRSVMKVSRLSHRCGTGHRAGLTGRPPVDSFPARRCSQLTFLLRYQAPTQAAGPGPRRGGAPGPRVGTVRTVSGRGAALGVPLTSRGNSSTRPSPSDWTPTPQPPPATWPAPRRSAPNSRAAQGRADADQLAVVGLLGDHLAQGDWL